MPHAHQMEIHVCVRLHPLGAAPNFHACAGKKDKSAHAHVGVHEALDINTDFSCYGSRVQ